MADIGYDYSRSECVRLATDFAISLGKRKNSEPCLSADWFSGLKKRWSDIHVAKPQKLSLARAKASSPEVLEHYFLDLKNIMENCHLTNRPDLIWNIHETGLLLEHSPTNIVCQKRYTPQSVTSPRGNTVTILAAGNATGSKLPGVFLHCLRLRTTEAFPKQTDPFPIEF
ncbi:hypothetical protein DPMN_063855 [Dreissena polymorpha]|uniref:HTH CENPB-type domain-containing protein n=1 Tax=Dreissena polymorpha TaxID=45954 RepID=A0A9D4CCJ3_DREPO|nr:hypothetical protein DPMN_063855 [Dreissena polymorpha]